MSVWLRPQGNHFHAGEEIFVDVKVDNEGVDFSEWVGFVLDGQGIEVAIKTEGSQMSFVAEDDGLYTAVVRKDDTGEAIAGKIVIVVGHEFEPNMAQADLPVEVFPLRLGYFAVGTEAEFIVLKDKEPYAGGMLNAVHEDGTKTTFDLAEDGTVVLTINEAGDWLFTAVAKDDLDGAVYSCSYTIPGVTEEEVHLDHH